jgi:signal transduction histidine kinase
VHWSTIEKSFYCVASDITARREVERLKQEFISMMSHDLRTPLMSIQASLALLGAGASGQLQPSAAKNVQDAERNISYIISLINSLIDVERIETSKLQIYISLTSLTPVLENAVQAVRGLAANKGIELSFRSLDVELEIDSDRIVQVLINLISNALKFSPRDTKISVYAKVVGDEVEICVADQGRGIAEGDLEVVFERFAQVEEADAREKKGSGLGLAICKAIVEAHHGTIGVRSRLGEGTTFWFRVPLPSHTVSGATSVAQTKA